MKKKTWYFIALFLPLVVPLLLELLIFIPQIIGVIFHTQLFATNFYRHFRTTFSGYFFLPILLGGTFIYPYLLFVVVIMGIICNQPSHKIWRISWALPILFLFIEVITAYFTMGRNSFWELGVGFAIVIVTLIYGYFYVLLAHALTWIFQKTGIVKD